MSLRFGTPLTARDDDDLAVQAQQGDRQAQQVLIERYRRFARAKGRGYFLVGGDAEDIEQEALIGLYKAIRDYQVARQASFRAFAELCITRQIITAIKMATRQKHGPLNSYVSLSKPLSADDDHDRELVDVLPGVETDDPCEAVISIEDLEGIKVAFSEILSGFESEDLHLYVEGKTYHEIADMLERHVKSIDNALQRIKRKIELHLRARALREKLIEKADLAILRSQASRLSTPSR